MLITLYEFLLFAFIIYIVFLIAIGIVFVNNFLMLAVVLTSFSYCWNVLAKCVENFAFAFKTIFMNAYFIIWCFQHFKNSYNYLWWLKFGRIQIFLLFIGIREFSPFSRIYFSEMLHIFIYAICCSLRCWRVTLILLSYIADFIMILKIMIILI